MEPRLRASPDQFKAILDFMERNGDLLRPPPGPQGRLKVDKLWKELTNILNSCPGGIKKPVDKWKKVWADWKTKTKKKYLRFLHTSATDGSPNPRMSLNATEERVVAVIGLSVVQLTVSPEQGLNTSHVTKQETEADEHSENVTVFTWSPELEPAPTLTPSPPEEPSPLTPLEESTPSSPPEEPIPPSPLNTSPMQQNDQRASVSPIPKSSSRRRIKELRKRGLTPFERAADLFASVEQRRLQYEETRDLRHHELETERLRLEGQRIQVSRDHNALLRQLCLIGQRIVDIVTEIQRPVG